MSEFVFLRPSMIVPIGAFNLVLELERAGHRLLLDGDDVLIEPAPRVTVTAEQIAELRRWKPHVRMLIQYTPDDSHTSVPAGASTVPPAIAPRFRNA